MDLVPASKFTYEELTHAYNQTRVDYLVPMPMNVARLKEYSRVYDIDLDSSVVVVDWENDNLIYGLGMLGVRADRGWITRLGVLPFGRRMGIGGQLMDGLIASAARLRLAQIWLEVIKDNDPAHRMFRRYGFVETRELVVARRPPNPEDRPNIEDRVKRVTPLNHEDAIILLSHRQERANWLNQTKSMQNVYNLSGLLVELHDGGRGWVTYHAGLLQITRIIVEVTVGDPTEVTATVLQVLHQRYKRQDAIAENMCDDAQWLGFQQAGYFESFRRIEMVKEMLK
ncbi:MAG TPA: GNAT family N-acetyltransferase [Anaerolineae bacterium]|nr:GNAT family N-acetyltransferase [Anaerolineae bacterium]